MHAHEALAIFSDLQDSQGMADTALLVAQASIDNGDGQTAMKHAKQAADMYQQLGDQSGRGSAMEAVRMAQEKLQPPKGAGQFSTGSGSRSAARLDVERAAFESDAGKLGVPHGGPRSCAFNEDGRSVPNGTRRGGLGFNSFGRNPFELR